NVTGVQTCALPILAGRLRLSMLNCRCPHGRYRDTGGDVAGQIGVTPMLTRNRDPRSPSSYLGKPDDLSAAGPDRVVLIRTLPNLKGPNRQHPDHESSV